MHSGDDLRDSRFSLKSNELLRPIPRFLGFLLEQHGIACSRRNQLEMHFAELAGEAKRQLVVFVVDAGAGIDADVEGLVDRQDGRDGVRNLVAGDLLAVD